MYFLMAKIFGFTPLQTDEIGYERVVNFLELDAEWRRKEHDDSRV